jgi:hypothetical protein
MPCSVPKKNLQNFSRFPVTIFGHMHKALNIDKNKTNYTV